MTPATMSGSMLAAFLHGLIPEITSIPDEIVHIEAEARASALELVREDLTERWSVWTDPETGIEWVSRAAVLDRLTNASIAE